MRNVRFRETRNAKCDEPAVAEGYYRRHHYRHFDEYIVLRRRRNRRRLTPPRVAAPAVMTGLENDPRSSSSVEKRRARTRARALATQGSSLKRREAAAEKTAQEDETDLQPGPPAAQVQRTSRIEWAKLAGTPSMELYNHSLVAHARLSCLRAAPTATRA